MTLKSNQESSRWPKVTLDSEAETELKKVQIFHKQTQTDASVAVQLCLFRVKKKKKTLEFFKYSFHEEQSVLGFLH